MSDLSDLKGKADLRAALLARRRSLPAASLAQASELVLAELVHVVRQEGPRLVAGYVPFGAEPGGPGLPEALAGALAPGARLLLPVLRPDLALEWGAYHGPSSLRPGARGLREPGGRRLGEAAAASAELVVVPALAVDRRGVRLGRGGGSYDRALARVGTGVLTVALLHDGELLDEVPVEPHDQRVRAVITPTDGLVMLPA